MAKDKQQYVCRHEYENALVGTLEEIEELMCDRGWTLSDCTFYTLGDMVTIGLCEK